MKHLSGMGFAEYYFRTTVIKYKGKTDTVGCLKRKGMIYNGEMTKQGIKRLSFSCYSWLAMEPGFIFPSIKWGN